jgi:hypothetical protein
MSLTMVVDWAAAWQDLVDDADHVPEAAMTGSTKKTLDDTRKWWAEYIPLFSGCGIAH